MKKIELARISGWDGSSIVGVFSTKEKALSASVQYLIDEGDSIGGSANVLINKEEREDSWLFDISNSSDILVISTMVIDENV